MNTRPTSYSALSGAGIYGGRFGTPPFQTVALVGDSLTALSYGPLHPYGWTIGLAGGTLKTVANCGVASDTVQDVINRINNSYLNAQPGLLGLNDLGWVFLRIGTNDFRDGASISAPMQAKYLSLFTTILTYAQRLIVLPVPPVGAIGNANGAGIPSVNAWLQSIATSTDCMHWLDDCEDVRSGGNWLPEFTPPDDVHFTNAGSCQMGLTGGPKLTAILAPYNYTSPLVLDPADIYPATSQWLQNPTMLGVGGSNSLAGGGQVCTNWGIDSYGSGFNAIASKSAAQVGDPNQTPWQDLQPTQITVSGDAAIRVTATLVYPAITTSYPEDLDQMIEVKFTNFDAAKFKSIEMFVYGTGNEQLCPPQYLRLGRTARIDGVSAVLRSAVRRSGIRVSSPAAQLYFSLYPATTYTGADMGMISVRNGSIRAS